MVDITVKMNALTFIFIVLIVLKALSSANGTADSQGRPHSLIQAVFHT